MLAKVMRELIVKGKIYDLGQPYFPGMPHHANHRPFAFSVVANPIRTRASRPH